MEAANHSGTDFGAWCCLIRQASPETTVETCSLLNFDVWYGVLAYLNRVRSDIAPFQSPAACSVVSFASMFVFASRVPCSHPVPLHPPVILGDRKSVV